MKNKQSLEDQILFRFEPGNLTKQEVAGLTILEILPQIDARGEMYKNLWCILRDAKLEIFYAWSRGKLPLPEELQVKVSELLAFDFSEEANHTKWTPEFKKFLFSLQVKLRELGFTRQDGIFLETEFKFN